MTVVVDTSAMLAFAARDDAGHDAAAELFATLDDELVTSPLALAEMDELLGPMLHENLASGALTVRWWADALIETLAIVREQPGLGLVDASLVALCDRVRTDRIASFDSHFENLTTPNGRTLTLLPERT